MKVKSGIYRMYLVSLIVLVLFCVLAVLIDSKLIAQFDQSVISIIQGLESKTLTPIMRVFTFIGSYKGILVILLMMIFILFFVLKSRTDALLVAVVIAGTQVINQVLKLYFQRARPNFHRLIEIGGYSFPSGHAMSALAVYGILTYVFWRHTSDRTGRIMLIIISMIFILMIGISRIYLGVHYPSDIIGGYLASGVLLILAIGIFRRYKSK